MRAALTVAVALGLTTALLPAQRRRGGQATARDTITIFASRSDLCKELSWRGVGPANFSGRIVDLAVHPKEPTTWYVASASGGLFKTTTRGLRFTPVFENEKTTSIGDVAIDPSNPDTVWVGTGEANNQRSSYWGDGVYKSTDGGKTWKNTGLPESHHIGRIVVDPKDGDRVFVAALGHLYTPNPERGLYRTTDGGKTWKLVLKVDADVGVVDVAMQPGNSKVLLAATYERRRRAWNFDASGPGSGIWRSTDGGDTWKRLEGKLPKGEIGRIGLDFCAKAPNVVYATIENNNAAQVRRRSGEESAPDQEAFETRYLGDPEGDAGQAQDRARRGGQQRRRSRTVGGEIYRSDDAGVTWKKTNRTSVGGRPGYYYGQIRVDPSNADRVWVLSVPLYFSTDGGKKFSGNGAPRVHVDHHALWIDPNDGDHLLLGNDGGLHESFDAGKTWVHFENLPLAQFYAVGVDLGEPYRIYGGTQDNGSWGMPSAGPTSRGVRLNDCFKVSGGDGFYVCVDPEDPNTVYAESQFGGLRRIDLRTMRGASIKPRAGRGEGRLRFNWMSPILISPHNHTTIYFAGNKLFKSLNRGNKWRAISHDLTTQNEEKLKGNVPHCTITTIAESPLRQGLLWVGTDDGELWMTPNDGGTWKNLNDTLPSEVTGLWVSRVEASRFEEGRAYVSFTGYREDMFKPLVYVTEDYGLSFKPIHGNLPKAEPVNVVREDPRNEDLLFVGTELGVYASATRGGQWMKLGKGMPRVAVHDLVVHPREPELVAATHGRGMYVLDVCGLEEWKADATTAARLVKPRSVRRFPRGPSGGYTSQPRQWRASNPRSGVDLCAFLPGGAKEVRLRIFDAKGDKPIKSFELPADGGLHMVTWNLRPDGGAGERRGIGRIMRGMGRQFRGRRSLAAGTYRVELDVDGKKSAQPLVIAR